MPGSLPAGKPRKPRMQRQTAGSKASCFNVAGLPSSSTRWTRGRAKSACGLARQSPRESTIHLRLSSRPGHLQEHKPPNQPQSVAVFLPARVPSPEPPIKHLIEPALSEPPALQTRRRLARSAQNGCQKARSGRDGAGSACRGAFHATKAA